MLVSPGRPRPDVSSHDPGLVDEDAAAVPGDPEGRVPRDEGGELLGELVGEEGDVGHVVEDEVLGVPACVAAEGVVGGREEGDLAV